MSGRRKRNGFSFENAQDPGKDLFAYLFLLIMVFSFMLLMTTEEKRKGRAILLAVFTGLAAGAATLVRPEWLLFTPFAMVRRRYLRVSLFNLVLGLFYVAAPA